jgi:predicted GH43/DUF377 family glycosyl hydrolase
MSGKDKYRLVIDRFPKSSAKGWDDIAIVFQDSTKRLSYISHLRKVILDERGFKVLAIDKKPSFFGLAKDAELGVEDARITRIGDRYWMTYVGLSRRGNISTYLAESKDCLKWERRGIIFGEQDKDVVLFPEKISGKYVAFDRPEGNFEFSTPHIWITYSKDLIYWGKPKPVSLLKRGIFSRSGAGPPPIKTDKGWLLIFHAATNPEPKGFMADFKRFLGMDIGPGPDSYAVWAGLFDLKKPGKIIAKSKHPIFHPRVKSFEDKEVVFPTGVVKAKDGRNLLFYSGAGDIYVTVRKVKLKKIMKSLIYS